MAPPLVARRELWIDKNSPFGRDRKGRLSALSGRPPRPPRSLRRSLRRPEAEDPEGVRGVYLLVEDRPRTLTPGYLS